MTTEQQKRDQAVALALVAIADAIKLIAAGHYPAAQGPLRDAVDQLERAQ